MEMNGSKKRPIADPALGLGEGLSESLRKSFNYSCLFT